MKIRVLVATVVLALCTSAFAAEEAKKQEMSAEEKAMMEAMMKAMTPGDAHKLLDGMVGTFDAKVTSSMDPSKPPEVSNGTSENSWVMGNRYVMQKFTGSFMGMPFQGVGYTGYDNIKKKYVGTWMDTMTTSMMISDGKADADGKSITFSSTMDDPMTGKTSPVKEKVTVVDADHHMLEMWGAGPDGKMFKMMEINYTRKK